MALGSKGSGYMLMDFNYKKAPGLIAKRKSRNSNGPFEMAHFHVFSSHEFGFLDTQRSLDINLSVL